MSTSKRSGADCEKCPLREATYIRDTPAIAETRLILVGSRPIYGDTVDKRALSGTAHWRYTSDKRFDPRHHHHTLAVACYSKEWLQERDYEVARRCCKPGLERTLHQLDQLPIVLLGKIALKSVTGQNTYTDWLGSTRKIDGRLVLPNYDNLDLNGQPELTATFWRYQARATSPLPDLPWVNTMWDNSEQSLAVLRSLAASQSPIALDTETTGLSFVSSKLLCLGLADVCQGVSLSYPWCDEADTLIRGILSDQARPKVFHNAQFDLKVLEHKGYPISGPIHDTMLLHAIVAPQLPHDLGFVFAYHYNAPRWKSERSGEWADTPELREYNVRDTQSTALLLPHLLEALARVPRGAEQYDTFIKLVGVACRMSYRGAYSNAEASEKHRTFLTNACAEATTTFDAAVPKLPSGVPMAKLGANGANVTISRMFFEHYKIAPKSISKKTHKPQLNDEMLQVIITNPAGFGGEAVAMAKIVSRYRKATKLLSTYIDGMPVERDGAVHPSWMIHSTGSRWRCSGPNLQNIPTKKNMQRDMRDIICARPGYTLVEADYAQQELRIAAQLSNDKSLLAAYADNQDVHKLNAIGAFGLQGYSKQTRNMAKTLAYSIIYEASEETMWRKARAKLPHITLRQVSAFARGYLAAHPELTKWHEYLLKCAERDRYVGSAISGKRWDFHGDVDINKLFNFPVQTFAGDLINRAIIRLDALCQHDDRTRLIINCHDAVVVETKDVDHALTVISATLPQTVVVQGRSMTYAIDFSCGKDWGNMVELPHEETETYETEAPAGWDETRTTQCTETTSISFPRYCGVRRRRVLCE